MGGRETEQRNAAMTDEPSYPLRRALEAVRNMDQAQGAELYLFPSLLETLRRGGLVNLSHNGKPLNIRYVNPATGQFFP